MRSTLLNGMLYPTADKGAVFELCLLTRVDACLTQKLEPPLLNERHLPPTSLFPSLTGSESDHRSQ
jgi:hypothetical protein